MKNSINKYLFYLGTGLFICFSIVIIASNAFEKTQYTLIVYEHPVSSKIQVEGLEDPNHRISVFTTGVPGAGFPDEGIKVLNTPLYVLMKQKNQDIEFMTDDIKKLNEYIKNEIDN
ncbi:hypothetical protein [Paenibacillus sp. KN14-4R]|uniref:hypothetical protein n=1 Tax=Paenibacillus sp. KN14-4R TaxID=3445773 RepID=UPI003FA05E13